MAEHLSKAALDEIKQGLLARHAQLQEEVRTALEQSGDQELQEIAGRVRDSGEDSLANLIADLNLTRINQLSDETRAIERALREIDTGGYGICNRCGQEIDPKRLKARPTAILCIECQRKQEQEFGAGRSSSL
jgi:RNA polymerase-binding protein DksA